MKSLQRLMDRSVREVLYLLRRKISTREALPAFDERHPLIFVLSTGRVGSQTLARLLALAPNLISLHEPRPYLFGLSKASFESGGTEGSQQILRAAWWAAREQLLDLSLRCGRGYVETSPQGTFLCRVIQRAAPSAKFIHLIRNPMEVIRSGMRRRWYAGHPHDTTRPEPRPGCDERILWEQWSPLEKNIWLWGATNEWIFNFCAELPENASLLLRAEDLFAGQEDTMRQLFEFVKSAMPSERLTQRILAAKLNAQRGGESFAQDDWSQGAKDFLETKAGSTMKKAGYFLA